MLILLASTNPHKLDEIRAVIDGGALDWQTLSDVPGGDAVAEPVEDADTFAGNATIKARHYAQATGEWCLADDSGIEVDALDGAPGVISARYAGAGGDRAERDLANNRKLLAELEGVPADRRTARFVCAMVLIAPPDQPLPAGVKSAVAPDPEGPVIASVRGTIEGRIILPDEAADPARPELGRGANGFGYDPLFLLPERGITTAELSPEDKNAISHRGNAARAMREKLSTLGGL
jgi:XTP/dITP diphosphohydrolase